MADPKYNRITVAGDTLIHTGNGMVHTVTLTSNDAAATAGTITLYDNTAESGTVILGPIYIAAAWLAPVTLVLDAEFNTGLYIGFATTDDVNVTVTWK